MPFGNWESFDSCVRSIIASKGWSKERASAYCAVVKRKTEGLSECPECIQDIEVIYHD